jgi:hypothetical protein
VYFIEGFTNLKRLSILRRNKKFAGICNQITALPEVWGYDSQYHVWFGQWWAKLLVMVINL